MATSPTVFKNPTEGAKVVAATSKFTLSLYKEQSTLPAGNVFLSPYSIASALAVTYLGARGDTRTQMKETLCLNDVSDEELHQAFSDIRESLKSSDKYKLHVANRLFGEKSYNFSKEYLSASEKYYGAALEPVDFVQNSAGAATRVNDWVANNTDNKIQNILSKDAVNSLTRLIIVNAIYFKGDWKKKFDVQETKDELFHISTTESVKVPLMHMNKAKILYGVDQTLNCQVIELPYDGDNLSMFVLLPDNTVTSLQEVEYKLTNEHLQNVEKTFHMGRQEVNIWLPRYKMEETLDLVRLLARLGIVNLFKEGQADLSGMDGSHDLFVGKAIHKAIVEVNEEGTVAAAATAMVVQTRMLSISKVFDFRADHPFIFFIRDNATKTILFLGRLLKP